MNLLQEELLSNKLNIDNIAQLTKKTSDHLLKGLGYILIVKNPILLDINGIQSHLNVSPTIGSEQFLG